MLSCVIALAPSKDLKLKLTRGNCSTRFWASQYHEFQAIIESFEAYVLAFWLMKEFEILGTDFVIDLCCVFDAIKVVVDLMVEVQALSHPCWKIWVWWPCVKAILEKLKMIEVMKPPESMSTLSKSINSIVHEKKFKGQSLITGYDAGVTQ